METVRRMVHILCFSMLCIWWVTDVSKLQMVPRVFLHIVYIWPSPEPDHHVGIRARRMEYVQKLHMVWHIEAIS